MPSENLFRESKQIPANKSSGEEIASVSPSFSFFSSFLSLGLFLKFAYVRVCTKCNWKEYRMQMNN